MKVEHFVCGDAQNFARAASVFSGGVRSTLSTIWKNSYSSCSGTPAFCRKELLPRRAAAQPHDEILFGETEARGARSISTASNSASAAGEASPMMSQLSW